MQYRPTIKLIPKDAEFVENIGAQESSDLQTKIKKKPHLREKYRFEAKLAGTYSPRNKLYSQPFNQLPEQTSNFIPEQNFRGEKVFVKNMTPGPVVVAIGKGNDKKDRWVLDFAIHKDRIPEEVRNSYNFQSLFKTSPPVLIAITDEQYRAEKKIYDEKKQAEEDLIRKHNEDGNKLGSSRSEGRTHDPLTSGDIYTQNDTNSFNSAIKQANTQSPNENIGTAVSVEVDGQSTIADKGLSDVLAQLQGQSEELMSEEDLHSYLRSNDF